MSKINPPNAGENVLKWAKDITREVNSLQPTAGPGQKVSKTTAGTTYAIDGSAMAVPDSLPKVAGLISSYAEHAIIGSNTTYSLERNRQNSLALFGFSDLSATKYKKRELSDVHFVVRDTGTDKAVLSAPTVRYMNANNFVFGPEDPEDPDDPKDPNWPGLSNILSVCPDSEMFWPGSIVSKSIYHNSKGGLAIYHFEELSNSDLVDTGGSLADLHLVTRDATGDVPTVKYTALSSVISAGLPDSQTPIVVSKSIYKNSENGLAIYHFENPGSDDFLDKDEINKDNDSLVVRHESAGNPPTVKYTTVSDLSNFIAINLSSEATPDSDITSAVTSSLYHNSQRGLALFQFEELSAPYIVDTANDEISGLHLVTRDATKFNNVPTVRYTPLSALSAVPDSELLDDNLVSESIQHNSKNGLALYHFEDMSASDVIDQLNENEDYVLVRHKSGNNPPVLKYTNKLSGGGGYPISGLTEDIPVLLSVAYSTTTHQFTQTSRLLHFSNGLLVSADNAVETTVFEAVEEQV